MTIDETQWHIMRKKLEDAIRKNPIDSVCTEDNIKPPTLKEILVEEFLLPSLAETLKMDMSDLQDILTGKQELTRDVAIKLSRYVGMSDDYFFNIQEDINKRI